MSRLAVFDFDGTLFRSPDKPSWWPERSWAGNPKSLDPPCVPLQPGPEWWISKTVLAAKQALSDPDTWAVLMTGRLDRRFRWRVPELLQQQGLNFDEVHLHPGKGATDSFKKRVLVQILKRYPFLERIDIWDDNVEFMKGYEELLRQAGIEDISLHPVKVPRSEVICTKEDFDQMANRLASRFLLENR